MSTLTATRADSIEVWVRQVGSRRQAFYRPIGSTSNGWRSMPVPLADKSLRQGKVSTGPMAGTNVVPRETKETAPHPMREQFAEQAQLLNRQIDALNSAAGALA